MFYKIATKKMVFNTTLEVPTTLNIEGKEVESVDTYLLENLEDSELKALGLARVIETNPEVEPFTQKVSVANYDEKTNLFTQGFALEPKSLEDAKKEALEIINESYETQINQALGNIPLSEILTWSEQEKEARNFLESQNESDAPTLKTLSAQRGIPLGTLCEKALSKAEAYRHFSSLAIGKRQAAEDRIGVAKTIEELKEILQAFKQG